MTAATGIGAIWDLDGTLADTEQGHFRAWTALCASYGLTLTWETFKPTFGLGNQDILRMLLPTDLSDAEVERLSDEKEASFRNASGGVIEAMPGAREFAQHLHALGVPQAIGSSAPPENIEFVLNALGLKDLFQATVSRWEVANGKPFPDIFLKAAEKLRLAPKRCIVFEDAPPGVRAALDAGMRCIALSGTWPEQSLSNADLVVASFAELHWNAEQLAAFVETGKAESGRKR